MIKEEAESEVRSVSNAGGGCEAVILACYGKLVKSYSTEIERFQPS